MSNSDFWSDWTRARRRELQSEGLTRAAAKLAAEAERRTRQKAAKLVGHQAAADHDLIIHHFGDGRYSTYLNVPVSAIPLGLRVRAEAWAAGPTHSLLQ